MPAVPHRFEIVGTADLTASFPATGPVPGTDTQTNATRAACEALETAYTGHPLRPDEVSWVFFVEADEWAAGAHDVECALAKGTRDTQQTVDSTGSLRAKRVRLLLPFISVIELASR